MNKNNYSKKSAWLAALLATALIAGCGGGKWDSSDDAQPGTETPAAPTVTETSPADEATDVAISSDVDVTFSEAMDASSIRGTTFTLTAPGNTRVAGAVSYSAATMTATFAPNSDLVAATDYTAVVTSDVLSEAGENLAGNVMWTFTTAANENPPEVTKSNPEDGGAQVCTNRDIIATFSEPVEASSIESPALAFTVRPTLDTGSIDGTVSLDALGTTAIFTPTNPLDATVEYTATVTTDVEDLSGTALENDVEWTFTVDDSICQETIDLGATEPYGVLSNTAVTLGGGPESTTGLRVDGDVGIFPGTTCNGCDTTTVSGLIESGSSVAEQAMIALTDAYNEATNRATNRCTLIDSGSLATNPSAACGGNADGIYSPGLYWYETGIDLPVDGTISLDARNDENAVFIFQAGSTVNSGANSEVILLNGAQAKNVFWVAGSSATIGGVGADFKGTILASESATVMEGTTMIGRALAKNAAVTVEDNAIIIVPTE